MQSQLWSPIQGDVQCLQKWKLNSDSVTESNISAPGYSSHGQNKSSNRYNFKTTAHPSFTLLMALAETWSKMADNDVINRVQVHLRVTLLPINCCAIFSLICVKILQGWFDLKSSFCQFDPEQQTPGFPSLFCALPWASSAFDKWFKCLAEHYHWCSELFWDTWWPGQVCKGSRQGSHNPDCKVYFFTCLGALSWASIRSLKAASESKTKLSSFWPWKPREAFGGEHWWKHCWKYLEVPTQAWVRLLLAQKSITSS